MNDVIAREILGAPVTVKIGERELCLSYPVHNIFMYRQLTGDSLFSRDNWNKIDFEANYKNWIACLWAGLHTLDEADGEWKAPIARSELEKSIGFTNAAPVHNAMVNALTAWMPKKKESAPDPQEPNQAQPANQQSPEPTTDSQTTGHALAVASD